MAQVTSELSGDSDFCKGGVSDGDRVIMAHSTPWLCGVCRAGYWPQLEIGENLDVKSSLLYDFNYNLNVLTYSIKTSEYRIS
jgi:hypothetical protein